MAAPTSEADVALVPNAVYSFRNLNETNDYFQCPTDSNGHYTGIIIGLRRCGDNVLRTTCTEVSISVSTTSASEAAATAVTVTATADTAVSGDQTVEVSVTGAGITPDDYTLSNSITIADGMTTGSTTFTVVDDALFENDETATLSLTNASAGLSLSGTISANVTITDNDTAPSVTLAVSGGPLAEDGGAAMFTANLSEASGLDVTVDLAFSGSAAGGGVDYTASSGSIQVMAGDASGSVTVTAENDSLDEINETIVAAIDSVTNGTEDGTQQRSTSITDDDSPPTVQFQLAAQSGDENGSALTATVELSAESGKTVTAPFTIGGSSTAEATDYLISASPLTFSPGTTSRNITITPQDDAIYEGNETVIVNLGMATDAMATGRTTHTATLNEDETKPSIAIDDPSILEGDAGTRALDFTLSRSGPLTESNMTVGFATADDSATVTDGDYAANSGTVTFPAGSVADQTVTIIVNSDQTVEGVSERLFVNLSNPSSNAQIADAQGIGTITDDDVASYSVTESAGTTEVDESGTTDSFDVVLDTQPLTDVVIDLNNADVGEVSIDKPVLTFSNGNWNVPQTVTVTGEDEPLIDGDQATTITLSINDPSSDDAFDPLADKTVSVTTTDDDVAGFSITETDGSTEVEENGMTDSFDVVLDRQPLTDVSIEVSSADIGEANVDKTTLTFTTGTWDLPQTVTVSGVQDATFDGAQNVQLTVSILDASSDDAFDSLNDQLVNVTVLDTDVQSFTGPTATGTGAATIEIMGSTCALDLDNTAFIDPAGLLQPNYTRFPHGAVSFRVTGCEVGAAIEVTLTFAAPIDNGIAWKLAAETNPRSIPGAVIDGNTLRYTIRDGGLLDMDDLADGNIEDPAAVGMPIGISTLDEWGRLLLSGLLLLLAWRFLVGRIRFG